METEKHELFFSVVESFAEHNAIENNFQFRVCWFMLRGFTSPFRMQAQNAKDSNFDFIVNKSLSCHFNHSSTISFAFLLSLGGGQSPEPCRRNCIHESDLCMQFRLAESRNWMHLPVGRGNQICVAEIRDCSSLVNLIVREMYQASSPLCKFVMLVKRRGDNFIKLCSNFYQQIKFPFIIGAHI